tara:strand:+ start:1168 stop:2040 length:873 start_codon:yes stop_codon:yes gene_type:complete
MIIWLASYPKSGNTWLRAFVASLLYGGNKKEALKNMKIIRSYPLTSDFKNLVADFKDFKIISENWINSQRVINLNKKVKFLKTHHVLCKINQSSFTNYESSIGVINIVRDPRNVITSVKHYYSLKTYDEAFEFICNEKKFLGKFDSKNNYERETQFPTFISSWNNHYNTWKNFKKNRLLIKYEDLIDKPEKTFDTITAFLCKLLSLKINKHRIDEAIKYSSFDKLKKDEKKLELIEAPVDSKTKNKKQFFYLGPKNNWKELLPNEIKQKIEKRFEKEMKELGYLNEKNIN